jgi:hypothetical protein
MPPEEFLEGDSPFLSSTIQDAELRGVTEISLMVLVASLMIPFPTLQKCRSVHALDYRSAII